MPESDLKILEATKLQASPTQGFNLRTIPDTSIDDLDQAITAELISRLRNDVIRLRQIKDDKQLLRTVRVCTANGTLTIAGLYALGFLPQSPCPALSVPAAVRTPDSTGRIRTKNLSTCHGPLPDLLSQSMAWVAKSISTVQRYQADGHMRTEPELPMSAVRESIANPLAHRDLGPYSVDAGKSIDVRLFSDRLVVASPGGLKSLTVSGLESEDFTRVEVNQHLYRLAKALRDGDGNNIIEGESGGVHTILTATQDYGLRCPTFIDTGVKMTVILWRLAGTDTKVATAGVTTQPSQIPDLSHLGKNAPQIYLAAQELGERFTLKDIRNPTGLSAAQVRYGLGKLREAGLVVMHGAQGHRDTTYPLMSTG